MKHSVSTVKVGLLAIVSLAALVFALIWLRGRGLQEGTPFEVNFSDVDGMREAAPVQMMGIRIGFVDAVEPVIRNGRYSVRVRFSVTNEKITIPKGSTLSIEQSGLIGEKFLEVTPPRQQEAWVDAPGEIAKGATPPPLSLPMPVKIPYVEGLLPVGFVERAFTAASASGSNIAPRYQLYFRLNVPGAVLPANPIYEFRRDADGAPFLLARSRTDELTHTPEPGLFFTTQTPMRMKEFLDIQLESAEALKVTNEKVAKLLSEETIATLNKTVQNTEKLTARATDVLESAQSLFKLAHSDLQHLVATTEKLAGNLLIVSNNVNEVIGDPKLKQDVMSTVSSIRQSSNALNDLMRDPALSETLSLAHGTVKDSAQLAAILRKTAQDPALQQRLDRSLTNLNGSLDRLSTILTQLEPLTKTDRDASLTQIMQDVQESSANLRQFSNRLKGRFLLFRLMF